MSKRDSVFSTYEDLQERVDYWSNELKEGRFQTSDDRTAIRHELARAKDNLNGFKDKVQELWDDHQEMIAERARKQQVADDLQKVLRKGVNDADMIVYRDVHIRVQTDSDPNKHFPHGTGVVRWKESDERHWHTFGTFTSDEEQDAKVIELVEDLDIVARQRQNVPEFMKKKAS